VTTISQYQPVCFKDPETGLVTIDWKTPDGAMPEDGCIAVSPLLIAEWVQTHNALMGAERMLGLRDKGSVGVGLLLRIVAAVCLAVFTLVGFDWITAEHALGWLGAGLALWLISTFAD
jgi:hypothetical protein